MMTVGSFARFAARPGKEKDLAEFLKQDLERKNRESVTPLWLGLRVGPTTFAIFDSFPDEAGRQVYPNGPIAKARMASALSLPATAAGIERREVPSAELRAMRHRRERNLNVPTTNARKRSERS